MAPATTNTHDESSPQALFAKAIAVLNDEDATSSSNNNNNNNDAIKKSIETLTSLSHKPRGTSLDDISTPSLQLLSIPYHLGRAHLKLCTDVHDPTSRRRNVRTSIEYFLQFLRYCEEISDLVEEIVVREYRLLLDIMEEEDEEDDDDGGGRGNQRKSLSAGQIREMKISRYGRKKKIMARVEKLEGLEERRKRLDLQEEEEMEGLDGEGLRRDLFVERLRLYAEESLEEIQSSKSELEMLNMAIQMEAMRNSSKNNHVSDGRMLHHAATNGNTDTSSSKIDTTQSSNRPPLQLTQITQDPTTGQLNFQKQQITNGTLQSIGMGSATGITTQIQRQQIAETVFRPGWNLPTMSLDELAQIERDEAIARSVSQKEAEAEAKFMPRRYEQLVRDGMEDDADLVEKSAVLDRRWDDWKEENPRGSGNKMGERGDRNF
ncbi:hypothetical protein HJC23_007355 [Cyclotella cryptica]|uniref:TAP42-like protein n=1 Tax=Cyclotella cryptica TaxID=29204 RepID=A0ABD3Q4Z3_9STRA|eukprot:CCRYP_008668-RE/>CCRYP_008668-RE protein AED:0.41 eAED:0.41 QI:76/1/1/1/1/1/2/319/433